MLNRLADYLPVGLSSLPTTNTANTAASPAVKAAAAFSLRGALGPIEQMVKDHPGPALAAAFIVGVTVAWWIKRR